MRTHAPDAYLTLSAYRAAGGYAVHYYAHLDAYAAGLAEGQVAALVVADGDVGRGHRQADGAAAVVLAVVRGLVAAGAERLVAGAAEHDAADVLVPAGALKGVDQLIAGDAAKGVVFFRPVDGDVCGALAHFVQDVLVIHPRMFLRWLVVKGKRAGRAFP